MNRLRIGVDLGGTKIEVIALAADGSTRLRRRIATPRGDYAATLAAVAGIVAGVEHELGQCGTVGVGIPGAESLVSGLIKNANSTCLNGKPLHADLQTLLQREVRLANDANCFALSEAGDGAGRGAEVVFGVILGTGGFDHNEEMRRRYQREPASAALSLAGCGGEAPVVVEDDPNATAVTANVIVQAEQETATTLPAAAATINHIATGVAGWTGVTNAEAASPGIDADTDPVLRTQTWTAYVPAAGGVHSNVLAAPHAWPMLQLLPLKTQNWYV